MAARKGPQVDFSKSTNAYPMPPNPESVFVDTDVDFSKSTNAYPMYDDRSALPERVVEHVGSDRADVVFPTPGPVSHGDPATIATQRSELGLPPDEDQAEPEVGAKVIERDEVEDKAVRSSQAKRK